MIESIENIETTISDLKHDIQEVLLPENINANVQKSERILSIAAGTFITFKGITNLFSHPTRALIEVVAGGMLLHRGVTGYCAVKAMAEEDETTFIPVTSNVLITAID